jgi:hypothetical protein
MIRYSLLVISTIVLQSLDPADWASAFVDYLQDALPGMIQQLFRSVTNGAKAGVEAIAGPVLDLLLYVPAPLPIGVYFQRPANAPWGRIFDYMWTGTIPLGFALLVLAWQVGQAGSSLGIIEADKTRKIDRGLFAGLFLIPISYVLVAMFLQIVNAITSYIAPSPVEVSNAVINLFTFDQLVGDSATLITAWLLAGTLLSVVLLAAALNILRVLLLLIISLLLPVLLSLKLAGVPYVEDWADKFIDMYVSLGFASIIMAAGLRLTLLVIGGGKIRLDGLPADNFIGPVIALIPFAIGFLVPAGSIVSSLNISQIAKTASAVGGAAGAVAGSASAQASRAGSIASKAGGDRAASAAKSEYSTMRTKDVPGEDELGDMEVNTSPPSGGGGGGDATQLPVKRDSGSVPDSAGGYSAGDADYASTPWGNTTSDMGDSESDLIGSQAQTGDSDSTASDPAGGGTSRSGSEALDSAGSGTSRSGGAALDSAGSGGSSSGSAALDSGVGDEGGGTEASQASDGADSSNPDAPKTTASRIANNPESIADGTDVSVDQLQYREEANAGLHMGREDTHGYFRDADGNEIPATGDADLEHGQTYDLEGATVAEHYESAPDEEQPDAVSEGIVNPSTSENGRYQSLNVHESTNLEESAQTYAEDFKSRAKSRIKDRVGAIPTSVGQGERAVSSVRDAPRELASRGKDVAVNQADEALLTEDARAELGKMPSEIQSGTRVQAERGSRVSTGEVEQTWTDDQTDTEMAAVQFDNDDDRTVVPKEKLSLSVSSPAGKTNAGEESS